MTSFTSPSLDYSFLLPNQLCCHDIHVVLTVVLTALKTHRSKNELTLREFHRSRIPKGRHYVGWFILATQFLQNQLAFVQLAAFGLLRLHKTKN